MTTPADMGIDVSQLVDLETVAFLSRFVQFQREWLDTQAAHMDQALVALRAQEDKLTKGRARRTK